MIYSLLQISLDDNDDDENDENEECIADTTVSASIIHDDFVEEDVDEEELLDI